MSRRRSAGSRSGMVVVVVLYGWARPGRPCDRALPSAGGTTGTWPLSGRPASLIAESPRLHPHRRASLTLGEDRAPRDLVLPLGEEPAATRVPAPPPRDPVRDTPQARHRRPVHDRWKSRRNERGSWICRSALKPLQRRWSRSRVVGLTRRLARPERTACLIYRFPMRPADIQTGRQGELHGTEGCYRAHR